MDNNQNELFKSFFDHMLNSMITIVFYSPLMPYVDQKDKERFSFHEAFVIALATNVCAAIVKTWNEPLSQYGLNYFQEFNKNNEHFYNYIKGTKAQKDFENALQNFGPIFMEHWQKDHANELEQDKVNEVLREKGNASTQFAIYESKLFPAIFGCKEFLDFLKRNKIKDINGAILTVMNLFVYSIHKDSKNKKHIILKNVCMEQTLKERERFLQEINKTPKAKKDFEQTCTVVIKKLNKWFKFVKK